MYQIELHLHTKYSSRCGAMDEKALVAGYIRAGYHGLVVTDHYERGNFACLGLNTKGAGNFWDGFLSGYYHMKAEGERHGLKIYRGAEIRFDGSFNDYLLFGYSDDLLAEPEKIFAMGLEAFSKLARADGALLIQAHPNRSGCTLADHRYLDGVEVLNMSPGHDNHNELTKQYADQWVDLIRISGSDCHQPYQLGRGGIRAKVLPEGDAALVSLLRSGSFELIG